MFLLLILNMQLPAGEVFLKVSLKYEKKTFNGHSLISVLKKEVEVVNVKDNLKNENFIL